MNISLRRLAMVVGSAIVFLAGQPVPAAGPQIHNINGSGHVDMRDDFDLDVQFRVTVSAHMDADGSVRGNVVAHLALREFDLGEFHTQSKVVCIVVDGDKAWVESVVTHSSNEDLVAVGDHLITMIFDQGGEREDIMHQEAVRYLPEDFDTDDDGDIDCYDRVPLTETVVDQGDYKVR